MPCILNLSNCLTDVSIMKVDDDKIPPLPSRILFHSDGAQALGKIRVDVSAMRVDYFTIVGHKVRRGNAMGPSKEAKTEVVAPHGILRAIIASPASVQCLN